MSHFQRLLLYLYNNDSSSTQSQPPASALFSLSESEVTKVIEDIHEKWKVDKPVWWPAITRLLQLIPVPHNISDINYKRSVETIQLITTLFFRNIPQKHIQNMIEIIKLIKTRFSTILFRDSLLKYIDDHEDLDYFCTPICLGSGTSAKVLLGYDKRDGKKVAFKIVDLSAIKIPKGYIKTEVAISKTFDDPHIIHLYHSYEVGQTLVMILEYCPGGTLENYIANFPNKKVPEQHILSITQQIASGLEYLRGLNVSHRDLKPANILVTEDGKHIKIADFTFAKVLLENQTTKTVCGTPFYMAPELFLHQGYSDNADLWSLGVILFEMFVGHLPFQAQLINQIIHGRTDALQQSIDRCIDQLAELKSSANFSNLVSSLLKVLPEERISLRDFFVHPFLQRKPREVLVGDSQKNLEPQSKELLEISKQTDSQLKELLEINKQKDNQIALLEEALKKEQQRTKILEESFSNLQKTILSLSEGILFAQKASQILESQLR